MDSLADGDSDRMPAHAWVTLIVGGDFSQRAAIGVIVTWQQKNRADRRSEWWRRTQWAFERTFSAEDHQRDLGWRMLATLMKSKLATRDEADILQVIAEHAAISGTEGGR